MDWSTPFLRRVCKIGPYLDQSLNLGDGRGATWVFKARYQRRANRTGVRGRAHFTNDEINRCKTVAINSTIQNIGLGDDVCSFVKKKSQSSMLSERSCTVQRGLSKYRRTPNISAMIKEYLDDLMMVVSNGFNQGAFPAHVRYVDVHSRSQ